MAYFFSILLVTATALFTAALSQVHAEEQPDKPICVRGLIVSARHGLTINDGIRDYLLLDVDNIGIEGTICEVFGALTEIDGFIAIDVYRVRLIATEYPLDDSIGFQHGHQALKRNAQARHSGGAMGFPGVAMAGLCHQRRA